MKTSDSEFLLKMADQLTLRGLSDGDNRVLRLREIGKAMSSQKNTPELEKSVQDIRNQLKYFEDMQEDISILKERVAEHSNVLKDTAGSLLSNASAIIGNSKGITDLESKVNELRPKEVRPELGGVAIELLDKLQHVFVNNNYEEFVRITGTIVREWKNAKS